MAVVCALIAVACVVVLVSARHVRSTGVNATLVVAIAVALVVATAGPPLVVVVGGWTGDVKDLVAATLMYSLPFAAALALSGLMPRFPALASAGAVASSALIATVGESSLFELGDAQALVIAAAVVVAATRLLPLPKRTSTETAKSLR